MRITKEQLKKIIKEELDNLIGEDQEMAKDIFRPEAGLEYWKQGLVLLSDSGLIPELDDRGTYVDVANPSYLKGGAAGLEVHYWGDPERINELKQFLESVGVRNYATIRYGKNPLKKDFSGADPDFDKDTATGVFYRNKGKDGIILFDAQDHV